MKIVLRPADRQSLTWLQRGVEHLRQMLSALKRLLSVQPLANTMALTPIRISSQRPVSQPLQRRRHL